jgi:hypothetical protein
MGLKIYDESEYVSIATVANSILENHGISRVLILFIVHTIDHRSNQHKPATNSLNLWCITVL